MEDPAKEKRSYEIALSDFDVLTNVGNIGFFRSCIVHEIFMIDGNTNKIVNVFTRVCFKDSEKVEGRKFLTKGLIEFVDNLKLGAQTYELTIEEAKNCFQEAIRTSKWIGDNENGSTVFCKKVLPKQFVSNRIEERLRALLTPNNSGSACIELFDAAKHGLKPFYEVENIGKFEEIVPKLAAATGINLGAASDRLGNIIFQFPVTILKIDIAPNKTWTGFDIKFFWNQSLKDIPDCFIHIVARIEQSISGSALVRYDRTASQHVEIGNLDCEPEIFIYRENPNLIIGKFDYCCSRPTGVNISGEVGIRKYYKQAERREIKIYENLSDKIASNSDYMNAINSNLNLLERQNLERDLKFKQYFPGQINEAFSDVSKIIRDQSKYGVYIWDPFLAPNDLLETVYMCPVKDAPIKAIGSITDTVKQVYGKKGKSVSDILNEYVVDLEDKRNSLFGLNLEYRLQHSGYGYSFHDRFLIFPGGPDRGVLVYSIGTSINSLGQNHHIIQEVAHPQLILNAFLELWEKLDRKECNVWKLPK